MINSTSTDLETAVISSSAGPDTRVTRFTVHNGKNRIKIRGAAMMKDNILTALHTDTMDLPSGHTEIIQHDVMYTNSNNTWNMNKSSPVIVDNVIRNDAGEGSSTT